MLLTFIQLVNKRSILKCLGLVKMSKKINIINFDVESSYNKPNFHFFPIHHPFMNDFENIPILFFNIQLNQWAKKKQFNLFYSHG